MKTKSYNHLTITARPVKDASIYNEGNVARMSVAHNIGKDVFYLDAVMFAHKGTKMERTLPVDKFTKGTLLKLDGFLQPKRDKDNKPIANQFDFVITKVSEPEVVEDDKAESEDEKEAEA